jgi:hypothetical protein
VALTDEASADAAAVFWSTPLTRSRCRSPVSMPMFDAWSSSSSATSATPSPSATTCSGEVQRCAPKGEGRQKGPPAKASDQEYHADEHEDSEADGPCLGVSVVIPVHGLMVDVSMSRRSRSLLT